MDGRSPSFPQFLKRNTSEIRSETIQANYFHVSDTKQSQSSAKAIRCRVVDEVNTVNKDTDTLKSMFKR